MREEPKHIREIRTRLRFGTITRTEYDDLTEWLGHPPQSRPHRNHRAAHGNVEGLIKRTPTVG